MADNQNDVDIRFRFLSEGDQKVLDSIAKLRNETKSTASVADQLTTSFAKLSRENQLDSAIKNAARLRDEMGNADEAARTLLKNLEEIGATGSEIEGAARKFAEFKQVQVEGGGGGNLSGLRRTGGALSQLGAGEIGGAISRIGDVTEVVKEFSGVLPDVAGGAVAAAGGLAPFVAILAPIAGIAALAAVAVGDYNQKLKESHDAFALVIADEQKKTDIAINNITAARNTTAAQNLQNAQDQEAAFQIQRQHIADLQKQKDAIDAQLSSPLQFAQTLIGNRGSTVALQDGSDQLKKSIEDAVKTLGDMQAQVDNTVRVLGPAVDAHQKEVDALEAAKKAEEERTKALRDAAAETKKNDAEIEQARKQLVTVNEQLADAETKRTAQLANRVQEDQRAGEVGVLEGQIAAAQEQEQAQANADKLVKLRADEGDAEAQILVKQAERINQINDQYFAQQAKALASYQLSESRAQEDYSRTRLRKVEDLNASLLNLAGQRDVAGFVNTRSAGLTDLSRGDEDNSTAGQRRRQDYERQAQEADANRQKQLADLIAANAQETAQKRATLNKQINEAIEAGNGQLKQSQVLQNQLAALRQKYAAQDLAARRANEDAAYTTQITKLQARQAELNTIIGGTLDPAVTTMSQLGAAIVNFINQIRNTATSSSPGTSVTSSSSSAARSSTSNNLGFSSGNRNYTPARSAGRGMVVNVHVAGVGSLVSTTELNHTVEAIVGGFERAAGVA